MTLLSFGKSEPPSASQLDYASLDDLVLVDLSVRRDARAIDTLVRRYTPLLIGYLRSRTPRHYEDVYQETFARALANIETLRRRDRFGPWLLTIANRAFVDWVREDARHSGAHDREAAAEILHGSPDDRASVSGEAQTIIDAIFEQPETFRMVLYLSLIHEKQPQFIAQQLGLRPGTVRMRLKRGLNRLRKSLERKGLR